MLLARFSIISLICFELLNLFGVLNFTLDFSWFGLIVTSSITLALVEAIYRLFRKKNLILPSFPYYIIAASLWFDAVGDIGHFYGNISWYDQVAHFLGGMAVMSMALGILSKYRQKYEMGIVTMIFICLAFTSFFGDLYEMEEYLEDVLYHHRQVRLGDGPDTANDLMMNLIGGTVTGAIYLLTRKKS